ncbi:fimbrial protein [Gallibacterium anatis str. Avicor]|uniref:FlfA n=1 Tax=Gallibacterium anatis TaxID=750 RepID=L0L7F7_9PAST|nr:fimbrial protein [Gallibacterium anatis]AGB57180.1 FlfA [Gallibacterium anatis]KGQ54470.1 fimbrial protein [Gallibacterium anatis str. Avicor]
MKKLLLTTLITAGLGLSAQGAFADDPSAANSTNGGLITITGKVTDTTCLINGKENGDLPVQLPPVSTKALATQGATTGDTAFTIELSGCQSATNQLATKAAAFFVNESDKVTADGKLLNKPDSGDAAQNVVVQLLHGDDTPIDITKPYAEQTKEPQKAGIDPSKKTATLKYKARYYATGVATAGVVKSTVNYTIAYE